jgi:hypothetical protein
MDLDVDTVLLLLYRWAFQHGEDWECLVSID